MTTSSNVNLTHLVEAGQQQATAANDALNILDAVVQCNVIDSSPSTTPPGGPSEGDRYIVPGSATGAWAGQDDDIAVYLSGWVFITPSEGWSAYDQLNNHDVLFDGTSWVTRQAVDVGALTDNGGGTPGDVEDVGASFNQATLNDNFATLANAFTDLRDNLRNAGLMA